MRESSAARVRESSVAALKTVYYVIVGLAIAVALDKTFLKEGAFVGLGCFTKNIDRTFVLLAFLCTMCRFVHGASLHLDRGLEKRWKPLFDFLAFLLQGAFFYVMALSMDKFRTFTVLLMLMLIFDGVWIVLLMIFKYLPEPKKTAKQWLMSDVLFVVALVLICIIDSRVKSSWSALMVLVIAGVAAIWDYWSNRGFYFPVGAPTADG